MSLEHVAEFVPLRHLSRQEQLYRVIKARLHLGKLTQTEEMLDELYTLFTSGPCQCCDDAGQDPPCPICGVHDASGNG